MVTIKDIAAATGLSATTISVVLGGKAEGRRIAPVTRERVVETAARLGFRHNGHARSLRTGRSNLIGVVGLSFSQPIPLLSVRHAAHALLKHGYSVAFQDLEWQPERLENAINDLESRRVEGLLVVTPKAVRAHEAFHRLAEHGIPIVTLDDWDIPHADVVTVDREEGAFLATRHLLALGHRRIALTVAPDAASPPLRARVTGYRRAHAAAGVPVDERLLMDPARSSPGFTEGMEIVPRVLAHPAWPTALFCLNDRMAIGAMRALYEAGKRVPEDLALVGFDGIEEAEFTVAPLTTVEQPMAEVAGQAVSLLLDRLREGGGSRPPRRVVVAPRLVVRRSSEIVPLPGD